MGEPKYTPGEWEIESEDAPDGTRRWIVGPDGETIAEMSPDIMDDAIVEANGRLIAAAPTLAETIRDQAAWIERLLQSLTHHDVAGARGDVVNGFAGAVVPDWELRQKLEGLRQDLALIGKGAPQA